MYSHREIRRIRNAFVTECIVCVPGHGPLTFSFLSFSFQADQRRGTLEQLVLPSSLRPDVRSEVRDHISSCERCTVVPCFRKKEGDTMLGMVVR